MRNALAILLLVASGMAVADDDYGLEFTAFGGYRMGGSVAAEDDGVEDSARLLDGQHAAAALR